MDIHQLETFSAVVRYNGFQAAGDALNLAQSTVSNHIAALERELGTQLIQRTTHSFRLLPAGQELLEYANNILLLHQKAKDQITGKKEFQLDIGASSVPSRCAIPDIICEFHSAMPQIRIKVEYADSGEVIRQVEDRILDVGIVGTKKESTCTFFPLCQDELILAAPNTPYFQKCKNSSVPIRELLREPFLLREKESGTRREMEKCLAAANMTEQNLNVVAYFTDFEALKRCVVKGMGVSILSRRSIEEDILRGEILAFPLDQEGICRRLYLVYREEKYQSEPLREFLKLCRKMYTDVL